MASKKVNPIRDAIAKAVKNYATGAAGLVRVYETVITRYWNEDSKSSDNLVYFINLLSDHPRVQQALVRIVAKHGKFKITSEGKPIEKNYKVKEMKSLKTTPEERDDYLAAIRVFKAAELSSFLNEEGEMNRDFDDVKAKEGFKKKAINLVAELMIKHEADQDAIAAALENPADHTRAAFDLVAAFAILTEIVNDAAADKPAIETAKEKLIADKKDAADAKAERDAKLKAARLEILAESQPEEAA